MPSRHLRVAAEAAQEAGRLIRRRLLSDARPAASRKSQGELVTETDRDAEGLIRDIVFDMFPRHAFFGEESGWENPEEKDRDAWVVDPLDGTTNFVHGLPSCAVAVAYCRDGRPAAAALCDIAVDELYTAEVGGGARVENRRIRVSGASSAGDSLILAGGQLTDSGMWELLGKVAPQVSAVRRSGSTALDFAWLARGRGDGMICGPVKYWDVAAGALILREAGGMLSRLGGETEFEFARPTPAFVAASPRLIPFLLRESRQWEEGKKNGNGGGVKRGTGGGGEKGTAGGLGREETR